MASSTLLSNDLNYLKLAQVSLVLNPPHPQASQMSHVESWHIHNCAAAGSTVLLWLVPSNGSVCHIMLCVLRGGGGTKWIYSNFNACLCFCICHSNLVDIYTHAVQTSVAAYKSLLSLFLLKFMPCFSPTGPSSGIYDLCKLLCCSIVLDSLWGLYV
jgi:hypothetical protein